MRPSKRYSHNSKRLMFQGIAAALECSPTTVERWDMEGCLQLRLLSYLDTRQRLGTLQTPTKPHIPAAVRRRRGAGKPDTGPQTP